MTEEQIKHMVNRFLGWRLPKNFAPDAGISYTRPNYLASVDATPSGTNLFDATQADAMVRFIIEGMPVFEEQQIEAAARWLMSDDTAYEDDPDLARRAATHMLDAAIKASGTKP